jgi:hypothetical protein
VYTGKLRQHGLVDLIIDGPPAIQQLAVAPTQVGIVQQRLLVLNQVLRS